MGLSVATTTWNSVDLIGLFLTHYRRLGFDQILVMDFESLDGTKDVLAADEWRGLVRRVPFPGIARLDSSAIMLSIAQQTGGSGDWCLFCDPDELLVTSSMNARTDLGMLPTDLESLVIPRFNVTARLSEARDGATLTALDSLTLRIDRRHPRSIPDDLRKDVLVPPWIFTDVPGKIFVRVMSATSVGDGDHSATTARQRTAAAPDGGVYLLHYPFRTYPLFRDKIARAREAFRDNPHLTDAYGWQLRRWIALADAGRLHQEYLQQFIPDDDLGRFLGDGTLTRDDSVRRFHDRDRVKKL